MGQSGTAGTASNVACFTGHRPNKLGGYNKNNPIYIAARITTQQLIEQWYAEDGYNKFITGMAQGYDWIGAYATIHARDVMGLPIKLTAYLPCLNQESMWPVHAKQEYHSILEKCDEVVLVTDKPYAPYLMQKRNIAMVDASSRVIACWNGEKRGGTWNCIEYANQKNVPVTVLGV